MIKIEGKTFCCGCSACASVCPRQCISLEPDEEGFLYPHVNETTCIDCGLCEKVCPFLAKGTEEHPPLQTIAAKNLNDDVRLSSSSGGLFTLFAEKTINECGVVFGAQFDDDWNVVHGESTTIEELAKFRGSKYVQSTIGDTYIKAKEYLKQGRIVLFSGTSCQIMGLKRFLGKEYPNLFTIDVICHGVPSPAVWKQYLNEIQDIARNGNNKQVHELFTSIIPSTDAPVKSTLEGISFRDKTYGWRNSSFALYCFESSTEGDNRNIHYLIANDYKSKFFAAFNDGLILRPSCSNCPAKGGRCCSDITLADFWGIEKQLPDFTDDRGISLCLCNTEKGIEAFSKLTLDSRESSLEQAVAHNRAWRNSHSPHSKRGQFYYLFAQNGKVLQNIDKCFLPPLRVRVVNKVKAIIKKLIPIHI